MSGQVPHRQLGEREFDVRAVDAGSLSGGNTQHAKKLARSDLFPRNFLNL